MKIGKGHELIRINPIHVDNWTEEYVENKELVENFGGQVELEEVKQQKYSQFCWK